VRLYTYVKDDGEPNPAVSTGDAPVDLSGTVASVAELIEAGPDTWRDVISYARAPDRAPIGDDVRLLSPLMPASLRDFLSFEDHVRRGARRRGVEVPEYWYEAPVYYKGNHRAIIGPGDISPWPSYARRMDFELELAMVIGKRGRDVATQGAGDYIFGFTILNDLSARDVQAREMSAWLGPAKGKDFANALGPCIVTADEVGTEPDLAMSCRVNGDEWGSARSGDMHWSWAEMIAHVSQAEDVWPGDVYGSGTPGGCCGLDLGRELQPGDVVELEIEKIGVLRNTIGAPPLPSA
jgi:2-keto-4-pentenoate hydratase/2-oxohepta-3-ene-1,7-dioic acid hydratase in catechol pathway